MTQRIEVKEGEGLLFANKKREKDTDPNARGLAKIDGKLVELKAWTNTGKNSGEKYQKITFKILPPESEEGASERRPFSASKRTG